MLLQLMLNGLVIGSCYALVSLGFALVYNTTRIFHIGYSVLFMCCPYFVLFFMRFFHFPFFAAFVISIVLTVLLSMAMELIVYQPLRRKRSSLDVMMVSSIGIMIIVLNLISLLFGNETQILNTNISKSVSLFGLIITTTQIIQLSVNMILIFAFAGFLKYSNFGLRARAMRDDETLFTIFGNNINLSRLSLFAASGFLAAVGGGLIAYDVGMDPYVGMPIFLVSVVALIIGGVGRFEAPVIGGFIIGLLQSIAVWSFSARWNDAITFSLLILFLLFRPRGLMGEKKRLA